MAGRSERSAPDVGAAIGRDWQQTLREKGYRLTPQREFVLEAVTRLGHATPDEVLTAVREQSSAINISTVYRSLELLEDLGLVRHSHITDRALRSLSKSTPDRVPLVRRGCGAGLGASPAEFDELTENLRARHGFSADVGHLTVFGLCAECSRD